MSLRRIILVLVSSVVVGESALAGVRVVTNLDDDGPGTLRRAILEGASGDTIEITVGGVLSLVSGELCVDKDLAILGPGWGELTIDAGLKSRIFRIEGANVRVSGLRLVGGRVGTVSPLRFESGGAILNAGALTVSGCVVSNNHALGSGGGIGTGPSGRLVLRDSVLANCGALSGGGLGVAAGGRVDVIDCRVADNSAEGDGDGGGIANWGEITMTNSVVEGNGNLGGDGGGIANFGRLRMTASVVRENEAAGNWYGFGGGICNAAGAEFELIGSTVAGNIAVAGGGIDNSGVCIASACTFSDNGCFRWEGGLAGYNRGMLWLTNCTISGNSSTLGSMALVNSGVGQGVLVSCTVVGNRGGVKNSASADALSIRNTILTHNGYSEVQGAIVSADHNLVSEEVAAALVEVAAHDIIGEDPKLSPLLANGGPTLTHALQQGSAALDQGIADGLRCDQRGLPRPENQAGIVDAVGGDGADIGAYEASATVGVLLVTTLADEGAGSLRQAIADAVPGDRVEFAVTGAIVLTNGLLSIDHDLAVVGPGASRLCIRGSGSGESPLIETTSGTVAMCGLTFEGGVNLHTHGGALANRAGLTLTDCVLMNNVTADSFVTASGRGGGLYNAGTAQVRRCCIRGNRGTEGGGIYNEGELTLENCTVSGNDSMGSTSILGQGGGIYSRGVLVVRCCTITSNQTDAFFGGGGGVHNAGGTAGIGSSIVAGNNAPGSAAPDLGGAFTSFGFNLIGSAKGAVGFASGANEDLVGNGEEVVDPRLGPLSDHGGPTPTHGLLAGSPAIDRGRCGGLTTDQRQSARPVEQHDLPNAVDGDASDIGAFEMSDPDTDVDGLPDSYERAYSLDAHDPADAHLDADGDGATNLSEFLAGTEPNHSGSRLEVSEVRVSGRDLVIRFRSAAGKRYGLAYREALDAGRWSPLAVTVTASEGASQIVDAGAVGLSQRFYRVVVLPEPGFPMQRPGY